MKRPMFAIYDVKAAVFANPFTAVNDKVAARMFRDAAFDQGQEISRNLRDYTLYQIGLYDDSRGTILSESQPVEILSGFDLISEQVAMENPDDRTEENITKVVSNDD